MKYCEYGCGKKATYRFKNGRYSCTKVLATCDGMRKKNSKSKKGINPWKNREHPRGMLGKHPWNYKLTKETNSIIRKASIKLRRYLSKYPTFLGKKHSSASKAKISATMKKNGAGGYRPGSGRGKKGKFDGIYCDSSWELAFVLWCRIKNRTVKRAKKKFWYRYKGKLKRYFPDFRYKNKKGEWKYVEIKGYITEQWKAKRKAFPHELILIGRNTFHRKILPIVHKFFGVNYIDMYE